MTAAPVLARSLKYTVTISQGEGTGKVYSFEKPVVTIGRGPENEMVFANDPKMSRSHAEFKVQSGQLYVRNVSQKNFILVDGEKVDEKLITNTAKVQVGDTIFNLKIETPPSSAALVLKSTSSSPLTPVPSSGNQVANRNSSSGAMASWQQQAAQPLAQPIQPQADFSSPPPPRGPQTRTANAGPMSNPRVRFYMIIAVVAVVGYLVISGGAGTKKQEVNLRTEGDVARAIEDSANAVRELKKQQETTGKDSLQYKAAQEHYIKGFRDYRQGQYARAMQSFQAALSFYPSHELARKYMVQAQRKFDEMVDLSMSQGRKYYQKQNYKLCQSSFANVMIMVKDSTKPKYKEAKQFYDECSLRAEGKF